MSQQTLKEAIDRLNAAITYAELVDACKLMVTAILNSHLTGPPFLPPPAPQDWESPQSAYDEAIDGYDETGTDLVDWRSALNQWWNAQEWG